MDEQLSLDYPIYRQGTRRLPAATVMRGLQGVQEARKALMDNAPIDVPNLEGSENG